MPLNDQFTQYSHGRLPLKPLAYSDKDVAQPSELMIDYKGEHPTYHIYIVDPVDGKRIIDVTNYLVKEAFGNDIAISIDGMEEQMTLHDLLNFIYKRFVYPDNLLGFDYTKDFEKVYDPNTLMVLLKNTDGTIFMPVTKADSVFDSNGTNLQERLDNMVRLGFANDYIKATQNDQTVFEITYPFLNYTENGNYMELRIGTTYIDKTRYELVDNTDENGDVYGCTITFLNDKIEIGRRIDILFIYNGTDGADGSKAAINGGQIARYSIPTSKLEKVTSDYTVKNEGVDNPKARYALKTELIGEGNNIRIYAEIEREEKETDLKNQTVCGLSIERSEPVKTDTVSVDGVCIGDSMDDVIKAFESPDITCPFADGYGKNCRFRKGKMYDLTVDLYQGEVSRIEIHRLTTDELTLFESFKSKWDESDQTKNMTIKSLSLRVPCNSIFINNSVLIGDSVKCRISREDREYTAENKTDEADLYRECFVELTDSIYGTNVEYEKGYVDGNPAVYFNHKYKDEEDGKEYYRSGVVFVTDYYMYWCTYTTLAEDENNRSAAGKILSSIKAEEPLLERISSLFTNS